MAIGGTFSKLIFVSTLGRFALEALIGEVLHGKEVEVGSNPTKSSKKNTIGP